MPPRIIESLWVQKIVNSAVWSSQCSNIKVIPLGKAERIMQEAIISHHQELQKAREEDFDEDLFRQSAWYKAEKEIIREEERDKVINYLLFVKDGAKTLKGDFTIQQIVDHLQAKNHSELDQPIS